MDRDEQALQQAIAAITQSDPLVKLLAQVRLGRMKPTDAGLLAITESWLTIYQKAVATEGLSRHFLQRIDPAPRVALLVDSGVMTADHPAIKALRTEFEQAVAKATA